MKPTEVDSMNRLRVQAEDEARAYRDLLVRMTNATSISAFHGLLCEAKELLRTRGVAACPAPIWLAEYEAKAGCYHLNVAPPEWKLPEGKYAIYAVPAGVAAVGPRCERCNDSGWHYADPLDPNSLEPCCEKPAPGVGAVQVPAEATPDMRRAIALRFAFDPQQEDLDMAAEAWRAALLASGVTACAPTEPKGGA